MNPNLGVDYMTEQITRGRLDGAAARGWLAAEAAASRPRAARSHRLPSVLGGALVRLGGRLQGASRPVGPAPEPAALPARWRDRTARGGDRWLQEAPPCFPSTGNPVPSGTS